MKTATNTSKLIAALAARSFRFDNERDLQDGIESVLKEAGITFERERALGDAGVIDFLVAGGIGIEVKVQGSHPEVARQLLRYADREEITEIILVTSKLRLGKLPETLRGKRLSVVALWESFL